MRPFTVLRTCGISKNASPANMQRIRIMHKTQVIEENNVDLIMDKINVGQIITTNLNLLRGLCN